jgi:hypothetical protein
MQAHLIIHTQCTCRWYTGLVNGRIVRVRLGVDDFLTITDGCPAWIAETIDHNDELARKREQKRTTPPRKRKGAPGSKSEASAAIAGSAVSDEDEE